MGSCFSLTTTSVSGPDRPPPTAKVITLSGDMWEFSSPIQSSLLALPTSSSFICNSNSLLYDEHIPALGPEEFIIPGNLYFVLSVKMLRVPLTGEAMARLALKATDHALVKSGKNNINGDAYNRASPIWVDGDVNDDGFSDVIWVSSGKSRLGRQNRIAPVNFRSKLGTIEEDVI